MYPGLLRIPSPVTFRNDGRLFTDTRAKSIDFVTAAGEVIRTEKVGTVSIPLANGRKIDFKNVALAPTCDWAAS